MDETSTSTNTTPTEPTEPTALPLSDPTPTVVDISSIEVGDRFRRDYGDLADLISSIKQSGFFSALALGLNPPGSSYPYKLLAGGRRLEACKLRGMTSVNAVVYNRELTDLELRSIELSENIYRKAMTWQEETALIAEIDTIKREIYGRKAGGGSTANPDGWNQTKTADALNVSNQKVSDAIKLARAVKAMPELAKCKTADDARKTIITLERKVIVSELSKRHLAKEAKTPIDHLLSALSNQYIVGDFFEGVKSIPDRLESRQLSNFLEPYRRSVSGNILTIHELSNMIGSLS